MLTKEQASISLGNLTREIMKQIGITTLDYSPIIKLANLNGENYVNYKVSLPAIQRFLPNLEENFINLFIEINNYFINAESEESDELKRFDFVLFTAGVLGGKETRGRKPLDPSEKKIELRGIYVKNKNLEGREEELKQKIIEMIENGEI